VKLADDYKDQDVLVMGVTQETVGAVFLFSRDMGWTGKIPVAVDENARLHRIFNVTHYPATVVIDANGIMRWMGVAATPDDIRTQVEQQLAAAKAAPPSGG